MQSLSITGATTLQRIGDAAQLTATATYSDGSTRDVTMEANWSADHTDIVSVGRGRLVARTYGHCDITASYGSVSARVPVRVMPDSMFLLSGRVSDGSGLPVGFAHVSITSASGDASVAANHQGVYTLPANGPSEVRAEMEGFEPEIKRLTVSGDTTVDFQLRIRSGAFGGMYQLTYIASPSCALPAETLRRRYLARVTETASGSVTVVLSGAEFVVWGEAGFAGTRDGRSLLFNITSDYSSEYQFIEQIDPGRELAFSGTATGEVGDTFAMTFRGTATVRQRSAAILSHCDAADHRLEFAR